jgi:transposase-like protein
LQLTDKSIIFTTEIDGFFKKAKKKTTKDLLGNNFTDNIQKYVEIFPNRKLSSGKYARVNPKNSRKFF